MTLFEFRARRGLSVNLFQVICTKKKEKKKAVHLPDDVCLNEQTTVTMETMTYTLSSRTPDGGYQRKIFLFHFFLGNALG